MSHAACTVSVVTTDGPAGRAGVTVSVMTSVSADTPQPTLLACVHHRSAAAAAILANGVFCVNVLRDDQSYISEHFAGRTGIGAAERFARAAWTAQKTGAPRVVDPLVAFDCRLLSGERVGTHHVFVGAVEEIFVAHGGTPLIYANRAYGTPTRLDAGGLMAEASRTLRLGAFHTFGPYIVPDVLERLARAGMAVDLRLLEGDHRRLVEALHAGEIELALLYDLGLDGGIARERLAALPPHVLLPDGHPLAAAGALGLAELAGEPLILLAALVSVHAYGSCPRADLLGSRTNSAPTRIRMAIKVSSDEIAVNVGSISKRTVSHIRFGRVVASGPPTKIAMTTSSNEIRNANAAAEVIVALIEGKVTYQSERQKSAPRLRAASSIAGSVVRNAPRTITITRGVAMTVCPR